MSGETVVFRTTKELEAGLEEILGSPATEGRVELIVRRPAEDEREILEQATLDLDEGLVGDMWRRRGSSRTPDGSANPNAQVTVTNVRVIGLLAGTPDRRALAGDQLYVDFDLSVENLPPGTQVAIGSAVLEVTADPHTGCAKFRSRFGPDALRFVNGKPHRGLRLRGLNARVVQPGTVSLGDPVRKLDVVPL